MGLRLHKAALFATILTASLGCLQPGIDPVFFTLLSSAHPVAPADHGWIVGATQSGMVIGSLIVWRAGARLPFGLFILCAMLALLASLATARIDATAALLGIRASYGLGMGMIYTRAMSAAAAWRPNGAYGAVFLIQLLLSTCVALVAPAVARAADPGQALTALAIVPSVALGLMLFTRRAEQPAARATPRIAEQRHPISPSAWALAAASLLFICSTMMVWSFTGALAIAAQIDEGVIGDAVAIGSIAGALTALSVMRERALMPLPLTGALAGLSLLAPIPATAIGDDALFVVSIVLLNIGSTAIIIRCSGMASAASQDPFFRRLVACTHSGGMILGPVIGSILTSAFGDAGLLGGAIVTISAGCVALILSGLWCRAAPEKTDDLPVDRAESAGTSKFYHA
ncbi:MFS transporter [Sphingobium nicotianae]|uniref:MFS transporter n=1 Tax=Sphingobium nicotianae TaxID=2782607 RepID=A0A9X1DC52_9SPHN|nr:MFS transporter [Sphingobium nicotianae]MBT2187286.1 MFS transporter [Sphingobium nicotianae]